MVDITRAKKIWKNVIREERDRKLKELDIDFMKALETGNMEQQASISAKKQQLRDATDDPRIEAATTIDELKTIVPVGLEESTESFRYKEIKWPTLEE